MQDKSSFQSLISDYEKLKLAQHLNPCFKSCRLIEVEHELVLRICTDHFLIYEQLFVTVCFWDCFKIFGGFSVM